MKKPPKPKNALPKNELLDDSNIPDEKSPDLQSKNKASLYETEPQKTSKKSLDYLGEKSFFHSKSITELNITSTETSRPDPQKNVFQSGVILKKSLTNASNPPLLPGSKPPLPGNNADGKVAENNKAMVSSIGAKPDPTIEDSDPQCFKSQSYFKPAPDIEETKEFISTKNTLNRQSSGLGRSSKTLNLKNEKFIEDSMQEIKKKLDENLKDFEKKLSHELSIISFLEDAFPPLETMKNNNKNELFEVFGFILSKYLFQRIDYFREALEKEQNFLNIANWDLVKINALLSKKIETFIKRLGKYEENMKMFSQAIKGYQCKDANMKSYLAKPKEPIEDKDRSLKKSFLLVLMGISEFLEKGKKHGASKFCYSFILRMYYFLMIYNVVGFYELDLENKLETKDFQENLIKMDLDSLKSEIIRVFKSIY